jgi:hypothetical protein
MSRQIEVSLRQNQLPSIVGCCVLLGVAEYFLYRVNFMQFFQGDALFWMNYRFQSVGEFLQALLKLDVAHWYRPLSNRTIPSLFYSFWGLQPYGYHLVVFLCFFATSCLVFVFLRYLTGKLSVAFPAAFYFSIHSNNVYTTYDFAFAPELFYTFLYVTAVWLFIEGERRGSLKWRGASGIAFVLSLMSKEAAVTLPAMLVLSHVVFVGGGLKRALRAIGVHLGIWLAYLIYVVGILGVGGGDYMLVVHWNVARNFLTGIYYALNFRREEWMPFRAMPFVLLVFLAGFALLQLAWITRLLIRDEGRIVVFGALWFVIALAPMLMLNVLGPYYLFLAMVGFSLLVGMSLNSIRESLYARVPWLSRVFLVSVLMMIWFSCRSVIVADTAADTALGRASTWAENSATDMLRARPRLSSGSTVYILDQSVPELWQFQGLGSLFKLVYRDDSVTTAYRSTGHTPSTNGGELVVMRAEAEHLVDVTDEFRQNPAKFLAGVDEAEIRYIDRPDVKLTVSPEDVVAGSDFYWLSVSALGASEVVVQYTVNSGPLAEARIHLNPAGKVRFFVSELTPLGSFRFLRLRALSAPSTEWIKVDAALKVLPAGSER